PWHAMSPRKRHRCWRVELWPSNSSLILFGVRASRYALELLGCASRSDAFRRRFPRLSAWSGGLHFATQPGAIVDGNSWSEHAASNAAARAQPNAIGRFQITLNRSLDHDLASLDFGLDAS